MEKVLVRRKTRKTSFQLGGEEKPVVGVLTYNTIGTSCMACLVKTTADTVIFRGDSWWSLFLNGWTLEVSLELSFATDTFVRERPRCHIIPHLTSVSCVDLLEKDMKKELIERSSSQDHWCLVLKRIQLRCTNQAQLPNLREISFYVERFSIIKDWNRSFVVGAQLHTLSHILTQMANLPKLTYKKRSGGS